MFKILVWILCIIVFWVPVLILEGYIVSELWEWFMVPLGVVDITLWHAMGLVFCCMCLIRRPLQTSDIQIDKQATPTIISYFGNQFTKSLIYVAGTLLSWGGAAIIHLYM